MSNRALIFFLKYPEKGLVKTRLAKDLGDDFVLELYMNFIIDILDSFSAINSDIILAYSCSRENIHNVPFFNGYNCIVQKGNDLGERIYAAFLEASSLGYSKLILIGSDSPDLPAEIISEAFENLNRNDIVLGPSTDGGYYLIGMGREKIEYSIFEGVPWSTSHVLERTIYNLKSNGTSWKLLKVWNDIDDTKDLKKFYDKNKHMDLKSSTMRFLTDNEDVFL